MLMVVMVNPRRACAARVAVVGFFCVTVGKVFFLAPLCSASVSTPDYVVKMLSFVHVTFEQGIINGE